MRTRAAARDLVATVERTIRAAPTVTDSAIEEIGRIYRVLSDRSAFEQLLESEHADLEPLKTLAWLPAEDDTARWHKPSEMYPNALRALIATQAPVLRFVQPMAGLALFLGIRQQADIGDVVGHLLALSHRGKQPSSQIYSFLVNNLEAPEIGRLSGQPVIYDESSARYWRGDDVLIGDFREDFGRYRCHIRSDSAADRHPLYLSLGARTQIEPAVDYPRLLADIAENPSVEPDKIRIGLVDSAHRQIARALNDGDDRVRAEIMKLVDLPVVLDEHEHLSRPREVFIQALPGFDEKFPQGFVRIARQPLRRARAAPPGAVAVGGLAGRADRTAGGHSGFAVPRLYAWCEAQAVAYTIGLVPNPALERLAAPLLLKAMAQRAAQDGAQDGAQVRLAGEAMHQASSWPHPRRVVFKAEVLAKGPNTRFVVTTRPDPPLAVYDWYVDRGQAENRIKDFKNALKADRLSDHRFWANQFRLLLHAAAYWLLDTLRRWLADTDATRYQFDTLRVRLLKIGGRVREVAAGGWLHLAASHPSEPLWHHLAIHRRSP